MEMAKRLPDYYAKQTEFHNIYPVSSTIQSKLIYKYFEWEKKKIKIFYTYQIYYLSHEMDETKKLDHKNHMVNV